VRFTTSEIARAVDGTLHGDDVGVNGVTIDSRAVVAGQLFVPMVAERNGHEFISDAIAGGASAYLTSQATPPIDRRATAIVVDDTAPALIDLGRHARSKLESSGVEHVVGITGSVGKTTVKDLTAGALATRFTVQASPRSFNNELGVPLTLANSPDDVGAVVVEMGARGRGHIAELSEIARPTVGVITTVALAHAEMFGTIEEVAAAKGELIEALPGTGTAVLNGDHRLVAAMASRTDARVVTFGIATPGVDVSASAILVDDELRASFHLDSPWGGADVRLEVRGAHQVMNALAAATAAMACGVTPEEAAGGLASATLSPLRMDLQPTPAGVLVLNDSYNANPTSMEAALRALASLPAHRRVAILGVMAELGPAGPAEHRRVAELARDLGIEVVAVDAPEYGLPVVDVDDALREIAAGDAVLIKGSRVAGLEQIAARLLG
jgi:UDP-N-acetylmuramoyl-tripeptide--D-alanyl-D-alanine ligase